VADKIITYDDDGSEADFGAVGARALVWQTYQRVYTPTQVKQFDAKLGALGVSATVADHGYVPSRPNGGADR
jgi:hypothetical protein